MIGIETDRTMDCTRLMARANGRENDNPRYAARMEDKCGKFYAGDYINVISQIIFTCEIIVKMCADCDKPMRFFNDKFNGGWNRLDFFVIFMGWLEMSPAGNVLKVFPVVVLRLLRLLRVFRLAKALPRLRSIVEALLSGLSAVGWICALVLIYNYIIACFGVLLFKKTDPFHFGTVGRAMFTILRIETLDSWDQILYITMFGCDKYPGGYAFLQNNPVTQCKHPYAWGWFGAYVVMFIVLTGSYIIPVVLIGIISIKYDEATKKSALLAQMRDDLVKVKERAMEDDPGFFDKQRFKLIQDAFQDLDADGGITLDLNEMAPFYHYVFGHVFGVALSREQNEALFHLMDADGDTTLGLNEFITFIRVIKAIEKQCKVDPEFEKKAFPPELVKRIEGNDADSWNAAMVRYDDEITQSAWDCIIKYLDVPISEGVVQDFANEQNVSRLQKVFKAYDSDKSGSLDVAELAAGLLSAGVLVNSRQSEAFKGTLDKNGDGQITFDELLEELNNILKYRNQKGRESAKKEAERILRRVSITQDGSLALSENEGPVLTPAQTLEAALLRAGSDLSTPEIIKLCCGGTAQRVLNEMSGSSNLSNDADRNELAQVLEKTLTQEVRRFNASRNRGQAHIDLSLSTTHFRPPERPTTASPSFHDAITSKMVKQIPHAMEPKRPFGRATTPPGRPNRESSRISNYIVNGARGGVAGSSIHSMKPPLQRPNNRDRNFPAPRLQASSEAERSSVVSAPWNGTLPTAPREELKEEDPEYERPRIHNLAPGPRSVAPPLGDVIPGPTFSRLGRPYYENTEPRGVGDKRSQSLDSRSDTTRWKPSEPSHGSRDQGMASASPRANL